MQVAGVKSPWHGWVDLRMSPGTSGKEWIVAKPLSYSLELHGQRLTIVVLPNSITDGASKPRTFWRLVGCPIRNRDVPAAIVHDVLYAGELFSRKTCDAVFLQAMKDCGVSAWRSHLQWAAVRLGGYFVWKNHTESSVLRARKFVSVNWTRE